MLRRVQRRTRVVFAVTGRHFGQHRAAAVDVQPVVADAHRPYEHHADRLPNDFVIVATAADDLFGIAAAEERPGSIVVVVAAMIMADGRRLVTEEIRFGTVVALSSSSANCTTGLAQPGEPTGELGHPSVVDHLVRVQRTRPFAAKSRSHRSTGQLQLLQQ